MKKLKRVQTENDPDNYAEPISVVEKGQITNLEEKLNTIIKKEGKFFCSQPFIHMYIPIYGFAIILFYDLRFGSLHARNVPASESFSKIRSSTEEV